jgi:hypothetical protein
MPFPLLKFRPAEDDIKLRDSAWPKFQAKKQNPKLKEKEQGSKIKRRKNAWNLSKNTKNTKKKTRNVNSISHWIA